MEPWRRHALTLWACSVVLLTLGAVFLDWINRGR
jgi:hypothetical protein